MLLRHRSSALSSSLSSCVYLVNGNCLSANRWAEHSSGILHHRDFSDECLLTLSTSQFLSCRFSNAFVSQIVENFPSRPFSSFFFMCPHANSRFERRIASILFFLHMEWIRYSYNLDRVLASNQAKYVTGRRFIYQYQLDVNTGKLGFSKAWEVI